MEKEGRVQGEIMEKIEYKSEQLLEVIATIFNSVDEKLNKDLNVKYFAFKHRPLNTEAIISEEIKKEVEEGLKTVDTLMSIKRSYCLFYLNSIERLFSKDNDTTSISGNLEYWVQVDKLPKLENLIDKSNIELSGARPIISFPYGDTTADRRLAMVLDAPRVEDVIPESIAGEMTVVSVGVTISLIPDITTYEDYEVSFSWDEETVANPVAVPLSKFYTTRTMVQKAIPLLRNAREVGQINLSSGIIFVLTFQGFRNNDFIKYLSEKALKSTAEDNNELLTMKITRNEQDYIHDVVIKEHTIEVEPNTGVEVHVLTLVKRGYIDGTTQS